jgi:hypothetical protein
MKLFAGIICASLTVAAGAATAQVPAPYAIGSPYRTASDFERPYAVMPPDAARWRYGPALLPPMEVYAIVRESGFSPLGIPQQRGFIYTISVINRDGDDGRLLIDGRTGRILRFMPAYRMSDNFNDELTVSYGPVGPPPMAGDLRSSTLPPMAAPRMASRTPSPPMPVPRTMPRAGGAKPVAGKPASVTQQSAAVQAKPEVAPPAVAPTPVAAAPASVEAKPAPQIQPTQEMPQAQGLD